MNKTIRSLIILVIIILIFTTIKILIERDLSLKASQEIINCVLEERPFRNSYFVMIKPSKIDMFRKLKDDYKNGYIISYNIGDSVKPFGDNSATSHIIINTLNNKPIEIRLKYDIFLKKLHWVGHWFPTHWHVKDQLIIDS